MKPNELTEDEKAAIRLHYRKLAQNTEGFRARKAQREMIAAIARVFGRSQPNDTPDFDSSAEKPLLLPEKSSPSELSSGNNIIVIEAPTGVGKSLAYMLPAAIIAQKRNYQLIISSSTVALQEQLVNRDLPRLVENAGLDVSFALAKGRGRYVCPWRLFRLADQSDTKHQQGTLALSDKPIKASDQEYIHHLAEAFQKREFNGDRDALPESVPDDIWQNISTNSQGCLKEHCNHFEECPFFLARKHLKDVDIIVMNHDLLLSSIQTDHSLVLPESAFFCLDEAHHFADKAIDRLSMSHSEDDVEKLCGQLLTAAKHTYSTSEASEVAEIDTAAQTLLETLSQWRQIIEYQLPEVTQKNAYWLLTPQEQEQHAILLGNTAAAVKTLADLASKTLEYLKKESPKPPESASEQEKILLMQLRQIGDYSRQIYDLWHQMNTVDADNAPPIARWVDYDDKGICFHVAPIDVSRRLTQRFWHFVGGAVLTSATLRALNSFQPILRETGLNMLPEVETLALDSPFNFPECGELYIAPDMPSPNSDTYTDAVASRLGEIIDPSAAYGTLVLFTSRRQMQDVADRLPEALLPLVKMQNDKPRAQLLAEHADDILAGKASILFGMDSFAEGLDLPGLLCIHVIITKLPFAVPDNPIEKTRNRWIEKNGGNPFMQVSVPRASVKLIQAVGRLIRTENDSGRVSILDSRLLQKHYGKKMIDALPPLKRI